MNRLSEVRYQLESIESQLRTFDNRIDYSTVYLYIDEVEVFSPTGRKRMEQNYRRLYEQYQKYCRRMQGIWYFVFSD